MNVTGHASKQSPAERETVSARPASIRDVASAAGVSYQTVSRVINGSSRVKESTRELVLAAIDQLGFRPNRAARALAGGPVQSLTVLTSDTSLYGYAGTLAGIEEAARAADFTVGVRVLDSADPDHVRDAVNRSIEAAGALVVVAFDKAGIDALAAVPPDVPLVAAVENPAAGQGAGQPWVWIDDRQAAMEATTYLLGLGHRTVHHVAIPSTSKRAQRSVGWRAALTEAGIKPPKPYYATWQARSGYQAGRALARDPEVTAVLCGNDDLAFGVLRAMHEVGRAVPGDVSVVGFDDIPLAEFATPALTTVRLDWAELGRVCFRLLRERMADPDAVLHGPRPQLVVRESTGPTRRAS
jgi:DNA-binding LacI/PurR family transcriptional regulator